MLRPLNEWDETYLREVDLLEETTELEKKTSDGLTKDKIAQETCGFANASGGFAVFGMRDRKEGGGFDQGIEATVGRTPMKAWIEQLIPTLLEPPLTGCQARFILLNQLQAGRGVLVLQVPESDFRPHWVRGGNEEAYLRVGEHSGRMTRRTFIDIINRRQASTCEIVSLGHVEIEQRTGHRLVTFNPTVKLISGPFCKDWLVELTVPARSAYFVAANSVGVGTQSADFKNGSMSVMGSQPLYPNRLTEVARPAIFLRVLPDAVPEDQLKVTLYPESGVQATRDFPLP